MDCVQNLAIYCGVPERIVANIRNIFDCFGSFLTYLSATKRSILLVFSNGSLIFNGCGMPLPVSVEWDLVNFCFHVGPYDAQRLTHLANLDQIRLSFLTLLFSFFIFLFSFSFLSISLQLLWLCVVKTVWPAVHKG